jgi:hypothetical protein
MTRVHSLLALIARLDAMAGLANVGRLGAVRRQPGPLRGPPQLRIVLEGGLTGTTKFDDVGLYAH